MHPDRRGAATRAEWVAALLLVPLALLLLWWSWGKWPDVVVDFGREIYVAWQIAEGRALYRDVMYTNGPLSPHLNALWLRVFGVGVRTLALANFAIVGLLVALLYVLLARLASGGAALLGCAVFLLVFAFGQQLPIGNYNFIAPYSHEITHGVVLALGAAFFLERFARTGSHVAVAASGLGVGLVLLTKPEVLLATAVATALGLVLALWTRRPTARDAAMAVLVFTGALLIPPLLSFALLARVLPAGEALANTLGGLRWVAEPAVRSSRFYLQTMGLLDPSGAARRISTWTVAWLALLSLGVLAGALPPPGRARRIAPWLLFGAVLLPLAWFRTSIPWTQALMPLPLFMLAATAAFVVAALRAPAHADRARLVLGATLSLLSLLLLAKVALRVRPSHYGFALAMPATMVLIAVVWDWLPGLAARFPAARPSLRAGFVAALAVDVAMHVQTTGRYFAAKTLRVGQGADALWTDPRGQEVVRVLADIEAIAPAGATLAVVPLGAMLSYLARRPSSVRYVDFDPFLVDLYGEPAMLGALVTQPPDFVVLADLPMYEYGARGFGDGYAEGLAAWIGKNYQPIGETAGRSIVLLRRNAVRR